jgi:hypothetical protein
MNVFEQIAEEVEKGEYNPLAAYAQLKRDEANLKSCIARVIEAAVEEAEKYPEKKFEAYGYAFERREGRKMYDFKHIPAWIAAKGEIKAIEDRAKAALAASIKDLLTATTDGEEVHLPRVTFTKSSLSVK